MSTTYVIDRLCRGEGPHLITEIPGHDGEPTGVLWCDNHHEVNGEITGSVGYVLRGAA